MFSPPTVLWTLTGLTPLGDCVSLDVHDFSVVRDLLLCHYPWSGIMEHFLKPLNFSLRREVCYLVGADKTLDQLCKSDSSVKHSVGLRHHLASKATWN